MASEAGNIIKHGWLFMVANVVNRAAGLLLLPLYTKILTPPESVSMPWSSSSAICSPSC